MKSKKYNMPIINEIDFFGLKCKTPGIRFGFKLYNFLDHSHEYD